MRNVILPALLLLGGLSACRTLSDQKEGPSPAEIDAAMARIDRVRDLVVESQIASDDDGEKAFWLSVLRKLGDHRDELSRRVHR
jgi:hypothetical protein